MDKRIIRLMAQHSLNMSAVADAMHYHTNTVRYHVDIIRRDTGKDASQFYDLISLLQDLGDMTAPVVRCKDCIHWNKDALACDTLPWVDSSEHANWYADDFCSYGERRGDG